MALTRGACYIISPPNLRIHTADNVCWKCIAFILWMATSTSPERLARDISRALLGVGKYSAGRACFLARTRSTVPFLHLFWFTLAVPSSRLVPDNQHPFPTPVSVCQSREALECVHYPALGGATQSLPCVWFLTKHTKRLASMGIDGRLSLPPLRGDLALTPVKSSRIHGTMYIVAVPHSVP
ncbi:hypothetical protein LZ31DRAFT_303724 [Colletotrichum somersetense]|nr:hypothetical protein LZ31DRAFT_303724 [Colletotrichum somersetense]